MFRLHSHCSAVTECRLVPKWGILRGDSALDEQTSIQLLHAGGIVGEVTLESADVVPVA